MSKISVKEAETIAAEDKAAICSTCDKPLELEEVKTRYSKYCNSCAAYWKDVDSGLFDRDFWDQWERDKGLS